MECFNSLLHKLRELHEREVEGWQLKIQELSNKKGCDTKRMEELFTKNQQMKDQQRLLTENIKTLENRLRAGLCDRCTVTQEVARKKQQELEATQMQSIQHITLLMAEVTNVKKENKRLREEIRNSRAALEGHSDHSSNNSTTTEIKLTSSPDLSSPEVIAIATSRPSKQPADGDIAVKTELEQRTEEAEHRQWRGMNRMHFESNNPLPSKFLKPEPSVTRAGERRVQLESRLDQLSSIIPQALLLRNSQLSLGGEVNPSRHVVHAPVPYRPQPVKGSPVTLPWPLSESSNWTTASSPGTSQAGPPSPKLKLTHFPNLVPTGHHANSKREVWGSPWQKQSPPSHPDKEPTVLFSLRGMAEKVEAQIKPQENKEIQPSKVERVSEDEVIEVHDGPLDLSDPGKSSFSQMPRDYLPLNLQSVENFSDKDVKTNPSRPLSSPSVSPHSSPSMSPVKQHEVQPKSDRNHKQVKDNKQKEEVNGKTDQSKEKKVPVLTISLRPVVVLETLNSALKKQESLSSNCKSSSPPSETGCSSEEQQEEDEKGSLSGQDSNQGCKRKRASVETETGRESDTDIVQRERRIKFSLRSEEKRSSTLSHLLTPKPLHE